MGGLSGLRLSPMLTLHCQATLHTFFSSLQRVKNRSIAKPCRLFGDMHNNTGAWSERPVLPELAQSLDLPW
jgi:hypothetical protein